MTSGRVLAVAHRAGNTLADFRDAMDAGVDLIEADVHAYRGRLEVRHTKSMGPLPWLWDRWYLVPKSQPRLVLPDLLAEVEPKTHLMLDLKGVHPRVAPATAALVRAMEPAHPVTICTRAWWMLDAFAGLDHVRIVHSARSRRELSRLLRRLARRHTFGVSVHRDLLTPAIVQALHRHAEVVMTWPVNTKAELDDVLALGVTGVISDHLDVLSPLLDGRPPA
ncbi:MAG: glycerophosphodiester phosphodiesterase [Actinomycetes bacterium]